MSADAERDRVVAWLRELADDHRVSAEKLTGQGWHAIARPHVAARDTIIDIADALSRNVHRTEARHD